MGVEYRLVYTEAAASGIWTPVTPPLPAGWVPGGGDLTLTDPGAPGNPTASTASKPVKPSRHPGRTTPLFMLVWVLVGAIGYRLAIPPEIGRDGAVPHVLNAICQSQVPQSLVGPSRRDCQGTALSAKAPHPTEGLLKSLGRARVASKQQKSGCSRVMPERRALTLTIGVAGRECTGDCP